MKDKIKKLLNKLKMFIGIGLITPGIACATEIKCFSGGHIVYHGNSKHIQYSDEFLAFIDQKTKHQIIVFADCILISHDK